MPITVEARRDFVDGIARLSLWLARHLAREGVPLREALTARTNLYRLTTLWDGKHHPAHPAPDWRDERWEELVAEWGRLFERHGQEADGAAWEQAGRDLVWPLLEARLPLDVAAWPRPEDRPYGFFTVQYSEKEPALYLHLLNPFAPASPFTDSRARAGELARLLADACLRQPAPVEVRCGSWLNSFPPFLGFFPPEYAASVSPPSPPGYHYGWWGQFMDRNGSYHKRNGAHLRRTGAFPFPCVTCRCAMERARAHLQERFGA